MYYVFMYVHAYIYIIISAREAKIFIEVYKYYNFHFLKKKIKMG